MSALSLSYTCAWCLASAELLSVTHNTAHITPIGLPAVQWWLAFQANLVPASTQHRCAVDKLCFCKEPQFAGQQQGTARVNVCLCAGGRAVIEGLGTQLGLSQHQADPSSHALYWYGNTSSSSLWYALAYIESIQRVKTGQRVWQVGKARLCSYVIAA